MWVAALFYLKSRDLSKPDKYVLMVQTKKCLKKKNSHQAGKVYKVTSKELELYQFTVLETVCKGRSSCTIVTLPRIGWPTQITPRRTRCVIFCVVSKKAKITSKLLKAFLRLCNVNVHESALSRTLKTVAARSKPPFSKNNLAASLQFDKKNTRTSQSAAGKMFSRNMPPKQICVVEMRLGNLIPAVKHGEGSIMLWACSVISGLGWLTVIYEAINSGWNHWILLNVKERAITSVEIWGCFKKYLCENITLMLCRTSFVRIPPWWMGHNLYMNTSVFLAKDIALHELVSGGICTMSLCIALRRTHKSIQLKMNHWRQVLIICLFGSNNCPVVNLFVNKHSSTVKPAKIQDSTCSMEMRQRHRGNKEPVDSGFLAVVLCLC